jgi:hypothetical protein
MEVCQLLNLLGPYSDSKHKLKNNVYFPDPGFGPGTHDIISQRLRRSAIVGV